MKSDDLKSLYARSIERRPIEWRARCVRADRVRARNLAKLQKQGVATTVDLIERLPGLSPSMKQFGIELISLLELRQCAGVLLELLADPKVRLACADALSRLKSRKAKRLFVEIGERELASPHADAKWLEAVVLGLHWYGDQRGVELLLTIFERADLPGWLRGDAADKLGLSDFVDDRRTGLYRRCRDATMAGLSDDSIEVKFWSMYLIGSLCTRIRPPGTKVKEFKSALPQLRRIAKNDKRLAPGYWWPMSAEAEDVIECVNTARWPDPDAAERWQGNTARGVWNRD